MRRAAEELQEAEDSLKELELKTIGSPKMDGMPKGSSRGDVNADYLAAIEYVRKMRDAAERNAKRIKHYAHRVCKKMPRHMRKFCEAYYVECFPFDVAQTLSGVKEAQCYRYMTKVNE